MRLESSIFPSKHLPRCSLFFALPQKLHESKLEVFTFMQFYFHCKKLSNTMQLIVQANKVVDIVAHTLLMS